MTLQILFLHFLVEKSQSPLKIKNYKITFF